MYTICQLPEKNTTNNINVYDMDIHNPFLKFESDIGLFDSSKFKYVLKNTLSTKSRDKR